MKNKNLLFQEHKIKLRQLKHQFQLNTLLEMIKIKLKINVKENNYNIQDDHLHFDVILLRIYQKNAIRILYIKLIMVLL